VNLRKGNSERGILHVTLLCCLCKGGDVSSELGLMKELLSVTGPAEIVGRASHCQSPQVTVPSETVGTANVNMQKNHCQSTENRTFDQTQPTQYVLLHHFTWGWEHFPFWKRCAVCGTVDNEPSPVTK
jgi:hypothetical protein